MILSRLVFSRSIKNWVAGDSTLCRDAHTFLSADTFSSSSGSIPRHSQASQETQSLQRVLGLPQVLLPLEVSIRNRCPSHGI